MNNPVKVYFVRAVLSADTNSKGVADWYIEKDDIYKDPISTKTNFKLHYGDMTDTQSVNNIIEKTKPDEVYNLAAQSHVAVSFEEPEYTANSDAVGVLRLLEALRITGLAKTSRFYQASTSELYGLVQEIPQKETTP